LRTIKSLVPRPLKEGARRQLDVARREIAYLEVHLTDHCNLNCNGCSHYSPLASPLYADLKQFQVDLERLADLFKTIRTFRLIGGEPLLHADVASFIRLAGAILPSSDLRLVTNGILLGRMDSDFWEACREAHIRIDITVYPPWKEQEPVWRALCDRENVPMHASHQADFFVHTNLRGDSDMTRAFRGCRKAYFCPFLQDGRIYTCGVPALAHYFNREYGTTIPVNDGIDIHAESTSARKIHRFLSRPIPSCKWCQYDFVAVPWSRGAKGKHRLEDWTVGR
jgi:hypothetical protein